MARELPFAFERVRHRSLLCPGRWPRHETVGPRVTAALVAFCGAHRPEVVFVDSSSSAPPTTRVKRVHSSHLCTQEQAPMWILRPTLLVLMTLLSGACRWFEPPLNRSPIAAFDWKPKPCPCPDLLLRFEDQSRDTDEEGSGIRSWLWHFGDNPSATDITQNPQHRYSTPGRYFVTLDVWDTDNVQNTITHEIEVF